MTGERLARRLVERLGVALVRRLPSQGPARVEPPKDRDDREPPSRETQPEEIAALRLGLAEELDRLAVRQRADADPSRAPSRQAGVGAEAS